MNRKVILLFSLCVVAIGVAGIFSKSEDEDNALINFVESQTEKEVNIVLAQSTHDLSSGTILTNEDYVLKDIMVPKSSELIKSDISNLKNINSHLLKINILSGSYITNEMLVSPDSREFNQLILKSNEIIYRFNIKQQDEYLLNKLSTGDVLSFQLRTRETDKRKGLENSISIDTNEMNDRKEQSYSLTKVIPDMRIIRIKKYSSSELSKETKNNQKPEAELTGYIDVIITTEELALIHIAEGAGDFFLIPNTDLNNEKYKSKNLHDILPQLRTIRELRG